MTVSISPGNSKMGEIKSVSLPAAVTCRGDAPCFGKCYARKIERLRPSVRQAYERNWEILNEDSSRYWREVAKTVATARFFRFHVSGDIPNKRYFSHMVDLANDYPHCEMLCFTKKYDIVNEYMNVGGIIPKNLHILFSAWKGLEMENPHGLPEAHVKFRDGTTTAHAGAKFCGGNCTECATTGSGCWTIKDGEEIVFNEH